MVTPSADKEAALSLLKRDNPNYFYLDLVLDKPENSPRLGSFENTSNGETVTAMFQVYPNPASDYTTLRYSCTEKNITYQLLDAQSRVIRSGPLKSLDEVEMNEVIIDFQELPSASYLLLVKSGSSILWSTNLVIQ